MEEEDFSKLPVDERCAHKSWKARVSGYEEAVKLFNQWDGDDANWKKVHTLGVPTFNEKLPDLTE